MLLVERNEVYTVGDPCVDFEQLGAFLGPPRPGPAVTGHSPFEG
jgi:hypothetical protein